MDNNVYRIMYIRAGGDGGLRSTAFMEWSDLYRVLALLERRHCYGFTIMCAESNVYGVAEEDRRE